MVIRVFDESGIRLLYVAVPAVAVLALIYYLYQREFFFAAVLSALGLLGVKVVPYHFGFPAIAYGYAVVLGVALVGAAVVFRVMQAAEGKLRLKGNWVEVLPKSANYALLYVTCGVVAAVVIAALLLGGLAVLYGVLGGLAADPGRYTIPCASCNDKPKRQRGKPPGRLAPSFLTGGIAMNEKEVGELRGGSAGEKQYYPHPGVLCQRDGGERGPV